MLPSISCVKRIEICSAFDFLSSTPSSKGIGAPSIEYLINVTTGDLSKAFSIISWKFLRSNLTKGTNFAGLSTEWKSSAMTSENESGKIVLSNWPNCRAETLATVMIPIDGEEAVPGTSGSRSGISKYDDNEILTKKGLKKKRKLIEKSADMEIGAGAGRTDPTAAKQARQN